MQPLICWHVSSTALPAHGVAKRAYRAVPASNRVHNCQGWGSGMTWPILHRKPAQATVCMATSALLTAFPTGASKQGQDEFQGPAVAALPYAAPSLQRGHPVQPSVLELAAHVSTTPAPAAPSTACIGLAARPGLLCCTSIGCRGDHDWLAVPQYAFQVLCPLHVVIQLQVTQMQASVHQDAANAGGPQQGAVQCSAGISQEGAFLSTMV